MIRRRALVGSRRLRAVGPNWWAAAIFAGLTCLFLWPALFAGRVLLPSSILYFIPPWTTQKPPDVTSYFNPVLSDIPTAYYPWWSYARESLRGGHIPQWNPYALGGTPFYANAQSALFSPFSVPLWILPFKYAFGVAAAARLWLAAFGAYLLARDFRLSFWPGVLAGVAFGFSAFSILWVEYPVLSVLALLPWALMLARRVVVEPMSEAALALALVLTLALLGGHPGSELHLYTAVFLFAVLVSLLDLTSWRKRIGGLSVVLVAMVVAAMVAGFVLLPVARAISGTVGVDVRSGGALTIPSTAMRTLFFPDWWGRPSGISVPSPFNFNERTVYAGAVAFFLALCALLVRRAWRTTLPFVVLSLIGFEAAFGLEPLRTLLLHAPALSHDRNARLSVLIPLSVSLLAGVALDAFLEHGRRPLAAAAAVGPALAAALAIVVYGVVASGGSFQDVRTAVHHFRTGDDFARPPVLALVSVGWWVLLVVPLVVLVVFRARFAPALFSVAVVALAVVDAAHFAYGYNPMPSKGRAVPVKPPAVDFLQEHARGARIVGLGVVFPPDTSTQYGLRDIRGNDPPYPTKSFMALFRLVNPAQAESDWLAVPALTPMGRRILNLLDVRYVVTAPGAAAPSLKLVYRGAEASVYRDDRAVGRVFVPRHVEWVSSDRAALGRMSARGFDPRQVAYARGRGGVTAGAGSVFVRRGRPEEIRAEVALRRRSLVVATTTFADGWRVEVDGHHEKLQHVDGALMGVLVPPGQHRIRWKYRTPALAEGIALSVGGLALSATWSVFLLVRRRRLTEHQHKAQADHRESQAT